MGLSGKSSGRLHSDERSGNSEDGNSRSKDRSGGVKTGMKKLSNGKREGRRGRVEGMNTNSYLIYTEREREGE